MEKDARQRLDNLQALFADNPESARPALEALFQSPLAVSVQRTASVDLRGRAAAGRVA
jgi:hypothetical protein